MHRPARTHQWTALITGAAVLGLVAKFFWPLISFDAPLGYDAGIYRYLFDRHAQGFPPFVIAPMDVWAQEHPLGLFALTTPLMRLGLPADWLIGWIWNAFSVALCCALAWAVAPRFGKKTALITLFMAFLSIALSYGFFAMYWKTFASLLWCVLAFRGISTKSWWTPVPAVLAVATHHQTGFLFGLVLLSTALVTAVRERRSLFSSPSFRRITLVGAITAAAGLLWYVPVWQRAVVSNLDLLWQIGGSAPAGSFPPPEFFLTWSLPLLLLGTVGFFVSLRTVKFGVWHLAVLWPVALLLLQFVFRNRFWLHMEFFLLPFAGYGALWLWTNRTVATQAAVASLLVIQASFTVVAAGPFGHPCSLLPWLCIAQPAIAIRPVADSIQLRALNSMRETLEADATVLVLEPQTAPSVRGWLTTQLVSGPGVFASPLAYEGWETLIFGDAASRKKLLSTQRRPLYLYISPYFRRYYGNSTRLPADPCISPTRWAALLRWSC